MTIHALIGNLRGPALCVEGDGLCLAGELRGDQPVVADDILVTFGIVGTLSADHRQQHLRTGLAVERAGLVFVVIGIQT